MLSAVVLAAQNLDGDGAPALGVGVAGAQHDVTAERAGALVAHGRGDLLSASEARSRLVRVRRRAMAAGRESVVLPARATAPPGRRRWRTIVRERDSARPTPRGPR